MVCTLTVSFIPKRNRSQTVIEFSVIEFIIFIVVLLFFVLTFNDMRK